MNIEQLQKQLEAEHKALDQKFKFISDLHSLMKKHGQGTEDLLSILTESVVEPARKGRPKKAATKLAAQTKATTRKKQSPRPVRQFKHPKTGEITESKAPQVDRTIKTWAKELKVDWRTLEV